MNVIDIHTHAFPDELAPRAIASLEAQCPWQAVSGGTVGELVESMDRADIDISVVCTIATKPDQVRGIAKWCRKVRSDRIEPLPSVHPKTPRPGGWIEKLAKAGFAGIKIHPMYQDFCADDPSADDIYAAAAEHGIFVAAHCGRDIGFPPDDDRAAPERFRRVIERHPKLKLICTHMGGWRMWDRTERELIGREVFLETSFSLSELGPDRAAELIRRHGPGRILFGTDWPWARQEEQLELLRGLDLTEQQTEGIFWSNAARLLGL